MSDDLYCHGCGYPEHTSLSNACPWCRSNADEITRLRYRVAGLVTALDRHLGTPCEQIRHQHEVDGLTDEITRLRSENGRLEAKMAEAVEALESLHVGEGWAAQIARTTLAELKGKGDE
jgi:hypothetical protein